MALKAIADRFRNLSSAPASPDSGTTAMYFKTDNRLYSKDSSGTEIKYATTTETGSSYVEPSGVIKMFAGSSAPSGYLICNGQAVSRTTYSALYTALGGASSPYGQGDGSTTFNVPNLADRGPVGVSGTKALGSTGGAASTTLTTAHLPAHNHAANVADGTGTNGNNMPRGSSTNVSTNSNVIQSAGSATPTAVPTQDPYLALNFIIKT